MRAWLVIGLIGCADVPGDLGFDDGFLSTRVNENIGTFIVDGPGYELEFGRANQPGVIPMPDRLTIGPDGNKRDILEGAIPECAFETRVGLALFPGLDISSFPDHFGPLGMATTSRIVPLMDGPGAVQYDVIYDVDYRSGAGIATFSGHSTFTFFATGRIVRFDQFVPFNPDDGSLTSVVTPFGCKDTAADEFFLTSYWAFENNETETIQLGADSQQVVEGDPKACTFYPERQTMIGVSYPAPGNGQNVRYSPGGNSAAHVFDFISNGSGGGGIEVQPGLREVTSAIIIEGERTNPAQCAQVLNELADGMLSINGTRFPSDQNGIYDALDMPLGSTITIESPAGKLPTGVAILLNLGSAKHAEVIKEGGSEPPAYVQQVDDQHVLFVLRDELLAGETVTIEPF